MSNFVWINFVIVFFFGILWGVLELVINYELKYVGSFHRKHKKKKEEAENDDVVLDKEESAVGYIFLYLLLNGLVSALAYYALKFFSNEAILDINSIEIPKLIIAGFGGVVVLRSSIFSIPFNGSTLEIGLISVVQALLDKIEKKIKHNIAANRICEIYEIMKDVDYEVAKDELPDLCITYIDGFSDKDSKDLINAIKEINGDLSNINKCMQLGREIARYCDVEILKRAIKKLPVLKEGKEGKAMRLGDAQAKDEFEIRKEKLLR